MEKQKIDVIQFIRKNIRWIILLLCLIAFLGLLENIFRNEIIEFDNDIYAVISMCITEPLTTILKIITNFGGAIIIILITASILLFVKNKKIGQYVTLNLIIITLINQALKFIIQRPRPTEYRLINQGGYSFPSGHSMVSMAFYGFFIYLIYNKVQNKYLKSILCIALSILILLIGISRIYLGVHYASDVIGGFIFSIGYLMVFTKLIKLFEQENKD